MRKIYVLGFAFSMSAMLMTGCGSSSPDAAYETAAMADYAATDDIYYDNSAKMVTESASVEESMDTGTTGAGVEIASNQKLIKNVNMDVETEEYDTLLQNVTNRIAELGGYIESSDMGKSGGYGEYEETRYANITARVPKEKLDSFVEEISDESNVISKTENTQDVTLQYVDVESHKKALEAEQERLMELLSQAESMEDIIAIESKLSEIRYQIESYTSQMRTLDNQVDYSTIYLYIQEVQRLTPQVEPGAGERIRQGFVDNVINIGKGIRNFVIEFIIAIPYLVLIAILVVIVVFIFRRISRRTDKKNAERLAKKQQLQEKAEETNGEPKL